MAAFLSGSESHPAEPSDYAFTADFVSSIFVEDRRIPQQRARVHVAAPSVRVELAPEESDRAYNEIILYDFGQKKMRRIFLDDRIYFEHSISSALVEKAMLEGWIPWEDFPNIKRQSIKLKEDVVNGHPCRLMLHERVLTVSGVKGEERRIRSYHLRWEASDLNFLPVRIIYFMNDGGGVMVEYENIRAGRPDPVLFQTPEGFLHLSPF